MTDSVLGWHTLILTALIIACTIETSTSSKSIASFGVARSQMVNGFGTGAIVGTLRGGSTPQKLAGEGDEDEGGNSEAEDNDDDDSKASISSEPAKLLVKSNWGNPVLDVQVELDAARTRNVASLKKSLSRLLPNRPPILSIQLVSEGSVLDDEMLVDDLFDEDDEDEGEGDDGESAKVLLLNSIPPVDPKFGTELVPRLKVHMEDDAETFTTEELLEAYFLNQVAISRNGQLLDNPEAVSSTTLLRVEMKEKAEQLQEQLKSEIPEEVWQKSMEAVQRSQQKEEFRGQRYRSGKGGARTNLKKSIQHNMNIDWAETIRNCVLFLFFGYFGGRGTVSRQIMLLCAPLCFVLQARPVKMFTKIAFHMLHDPPRVVLSLLPAPEQAILSLDEEEAYVTLYGPRDDDDDDESDDGESDDDGDE